MEFLEIPLFDTDLYKLMVRLSFNLVFVVLVVRFAYHQHQTNKSFVFTFFLMNIVIFFICFTLKKLDLGLGMALGLFAIFAIARFRTDAIRVKEMTYLFIVIGLAVINALSNKKTSYGELLFTNAFIFGATYLLERMFMKRTTEKLGSWDILYDRMELLRPERHAELIKDLKTRTGLDVTRVVVKKVDLAKGTASLVVRYRRIQDNESAGEDGIRDPIID